MTNVRLAGAIPAVPLLLDADRKVDWEAQRTLLNYYLSAGVDGLAVGVHTTQFELHDDEALLREVWAQAAEAARGAGREVTLVAGICGDAERADQEARLAVELGYQAGLLCAYGMAEKTEKPILTKARAVGASLPVIGFYLQESVGGSYLSPTFWRELIDQPSTVGVKTAPFDRYRTRDVVAALLESDRWQDVALLTGNDDAIVADLVMPHARVVGGEERVVHAAGGLLGQFAVGTKAAVDLTHSALAAQGSGSVTEASLQLGNDLVEVNAAVFDVVNHFAGCVAGVNEVLRQQGIAPTSLCLSASESLSPGQAELIDQARARFGGLFDEDFIAANLDSWRA